MEKHLLSICLPTNGVAKWVIPAVRRLYELGTDESLFEVVVADNGGDKSELNEPVKEFANHTNFRYVKTNAVGFYNIIECFLAAKGDYMIKLNHRSMLRLGSIEQVIEQAERFFDSKPLIYFSNGNLKHDSILEYDTFDGYLNELSYLSSLSEGLFFWKEDLLRVPEIKFAKMSPNVSLMFDSRRKNKFVLVDKRLWWDQDGKGKFGYDLFDTFAVLYMDLVNEVRVDGSITKKTFLKIKDDIFKFLYDCYVAMKLDGAYENYSLEGMKDSLSVYYSKWDYYYIVLKTKWYEYPKRRWQNFKNYILYIPRKIKRKIWK